MCLCSPNVASEYEEYLLFSHFSHSCKNLGKNLDSCVAKQLINTSLHIVSFAFVSPAALFFCNKNSIHGSFLQCECCIFKR